MEFSSLLGIVLITTARVILLLFLSPPGSLTCLHLPPGSPAPLRTCCPFGGWQATVCASGWTVARRAEGAPYGRGC